MSSKRGDSATTPRPLTPKQIRTWRKYLAEERMEAQTYRNLAKREEDPTRTIMLELADAEGRHERHWMELLGEHAYPPPKSRGYYRLLNSLASRFGSVFVLAMVQRGENRAAYDFEDAATPSMAADEHIHGEVVRSLAASSREKMAGSFRAAVFGINDGLVSNLALILGVAGAGMSPGWIVATGLSGLLAGALSMGAGEWISVSGQRELLEASLPDPEAERSVAELDVNANELELLFRARGESIENAKAHADQIFQSLGPVDTDSKMMALSLRLSSNTRQRAAGTETVGKPLPVAFGSFLFFALGALVPLVPFVLGVTGLTAVVIASALVGCALLITGGIVGILSGKSPMHGALRQLLIGFGAAAITYILGALFGSVV